MCNEVHRLAHCSGRKPTKKNEHKNHQKRVFVKFSSRREERGESSSLCGNSNYFFLHLPYLWPAGNNIVGHRPDIYNTIAKIRLSSPNIDEKEAHLCFCLSWKIKTQYLVL